MRDLVAPLQGGNQDTPLGRAQDIMYQAFEIHDPRRQLELARQALEICPDCADAYVLLAEHAQSRKETLELHEKAVAAGERALGPKTFQEGAGHFWGLIETRPYMRARLALVDSLWTAGRREEAAQHLWDMLRLNPNDNQGLRYTLAGFLLSMDRDQELGQLLDRFPEEGMAAWAYTRALLEFRQKGDTPESRRLLQDAIKKNKHVPTYLLGEKFPPAERPGYYGIGDENEALMYIAGFLAGWKATSGATEWVQANVNSPKKKASPMTQAHGPLLLVKKWLKEKLPQEDDLWQADFRTLPIRIQGAKDSPWLVLVTSKSEDLVLIHDILPEAPPANLVFDKLVEAMRQPLSGEPHLPTILEVRADPHWEELRPHLEEVGIQLETAELDHIDYVFNDMLEHMGVKAELGLLDVPGVKPAMVGGFFEAAAYFYQQAPWRKVGYESAIRVECDKFNGGPWYAVLMGQSGLMIGLALYEDYKILQRLWARNLSDEENARITVATTVSFGDASETLPEDLAAAQQHGWKVARPDAFPSIFHKDRGKSFRPPLAWEIELAEGCLRAVPDFVMRRTQEDATPEEMTVPVATGPLHLKLSWVMED